MPIHARYSMGSRQLKRAAFTLMELIVVVVIIVVLIAILIPSLAAAKKYAQNASTTSLMTTIAGDCEAYYATFNAYPGPIAAAPPPSITSGPPATTGAANGFKISGTQNLLLALTYPLYVDSSAVAGASFYKLNTPSAPTVPTFTTSPVQRSSMAPPPAPASYPASWVSIPDSTATAGGWGAQPAEVNPMDSIGPMNNATNPPTFLSPFFKPSAKEISASQPGTNPAVWYAGGVKGTGAAGVTNTFAFPVVLDRYGDAMPILYYRRTSNVDGQASTDINGVLSNASSGAAPGALVAGGARSSTNIAAYYYDENKEYTESTALYSSSGLFYDQTQGGKAFMGDPTSGALGLTREILTNGAGTQVPYSTSATTNYSAKGGFVLISAGYDHIYGPLVTNGKCDDIVVIGGTR